MRIVQTTVLWWVRTDRGCLDGCLRRAAFCIVVGCLVYSVLYLNVLTIVRCVLQCFVPVRCDKVVIDTSCQRYTIGGNAQSIVSLSTGGLDVFPAMTLEAWQKQRIQFE